MHRNLTERGSVDTKLKELYRELASCKVGSNEEKILIDRIDLRLEQIGGK